jgi:hypothetical protein
MSHHDDPGRLVVGIHLHSRDRHKIIVVDIMIRERLHHKGRLDPKRTVVLMEPFVGERLERALK